MSRGDAFSTYHPLINFLYFTLVLLFSMFFLHPVCLLLSLGWAFAYSSYLLGARGARRNLCLVLPLLLLTALVNPAFNHQGATILLYLPNGNPLTGESIWYGLAAGTMLAAVLCWFTCYNQVMSSDKFVYLFGRVIPALSLVLSMALGFVPKFRRQLQLVRQAQQGLGRQDGARLTDRLRQGLTQLSILITWALENAIETADSMRSRGYGLPGRSAFSIYRWDRRDWGALIALLLSACYVLAGKWAGAIDWRYFPTLKGSLAGWYPYSLYLAYSALLAFPLLADFYGDWKWRRLRRQVPERVIKKENLC